MSSIEKKHGDVLLQIANQSIQHGLTTGQPLSVKHEEFPVSCKHSEPVL
jgi:hypothetical protein